MPILVLLSPESSLTGLAGQAAAPGRVSPSLNCLTQKRAARQIVSLPSLGACKQKLRQRLVELHLLQ